MARAFEALPVRFSERPPLRPRARVLARHRCSEGRLLPAASRTYTPFFKVELLVKRHGEKFLILSYQTYKDQEHVSKTHWNIVLSKQKKTYAPTHTHIEIHDIKWGGNIPHRKDLLALTTPLVAFLPLTTLTLPLLALPVSSSPATAGPVGYDTNGPNLPMPTTMGPSPLGWRHTCFGHFEKKRRKKNEVILAIKQGREAVKNVKKLRIHWVKKVFTLNMTLMRGNCTYINVLLSY